MNLLRAPFHCLCLAGWFWSSAAIVMAAELDSRFDAGPRASGDILAIAAQSDGRIIVAGEFATIQGSSRNYVARLNPDGSLDPEFQIGTGAAGVVYAVALQPDGKILLGGAFWSFNGAGQQYLVRLHANGAVDAAFNPTNTIDGPVRALAPQPGGRVLIGGPFTAVAGQSRPRLARLHADGSLDAGFDPGAGANDYPRAFAVLPDGKILVAGRFTTFNGAPHGSIVRLNTNGAVDPTFDAGSGANRQIRGLALLPDGRFYIGGHFESYDGTNRSAVARLFPDGGLDLSFDPANLDNDTVQTVVAEPNGRVWIGGLFQPVGGLTSGLVARLNADGSADASVNVALDNLPGDEIFALHFQADGLLLMSGEFRSVNGVTRQRLARIIPPGTPPLLRLAAPLTASAPEGGEVAFTVERVGSANGEARVNYATVNGTAISGIDFTPVSGTLTFAPGETRMTISVPLLADAVYDPDESFGLRLENPQGGALGVPAAGVARILEASPSIEFTSGEALWHEGGSENSTNAATACLGLRRTGYVPGQVWSVDFEIIPGTARPGEDFTGLLAGTVDFTDGSDFRCLWIPLINDGRVEPTKTLAVRLVRATGAVLTGSNVATLTIWDDDGPIQWALTGLKVPENAGQARLEIRRNDNGPSPVTVSYATASGTALAGEEFVPASGSVILEPLQRSAPLAVTLLDDCRIEADETLTVTLSVADGGSSLGTNPTARVVLQDDERPGSFDTTFDASGWMPQIWGYNFAAYATHIDGCILIGGSSADGRIDRLRRDGSLDPYFAATNFVPPPPMVGFIQWAQIWELQAQPDGRVLIGASREVFPGDITFSFPHLLRLNADGTRDETFQIDARITVRPWDSPFSLQPDGRLLVVHYVTNDPGGFLRQRLARLLSSGLLDESFQPSPDLMSIRAMTSTPNRCILVSGTFSRDGTNFGGVARLLPDGALDRAFTPAMFQRISSAGFTSDSPPNLLVAQPDGAVLAGGEFNRVNGVVRAGLARLRPDGAVDAAFHPAASLPAGVDPTVAALLLDERGRILISGPLAWALAGPRYPVARLRSGGQLDGSFRMNENDLSGWPAQLLLTDDRKIVIAGPYFGLHRLNGDPAPRLAARLLLSGEGLEISTPTITGDTYRLQATMDFQNWQTLETRQAEDCCLKFLLPSPVHPRFFRIERLPAP